LGFVDSLRDDSIEKDRSLALEAIISKTSNAKRIPGTRP